MYHWLKRYSSNREHHQEANKKDSEIKRLQKELRRVTEERDILKKSPRTLPESPCKVRLYSTNQDQYPTRTLCKLLEPHYSGFYAWRHDPVSPRAKEDQRLLGLIKQSWLESGCIYGYHKIHHDLKDLGEHCSKHRAFRLMRLDGLSAQVGYKKHQGKASGRPSHVADNILQRQFQATVPNELWVTDITYIRTHEGWLYLAVVLDLYTRQVIGWSMHSRMETDLVLNALLMAAWRRKPQEEVVIHSDQGSQFTGYEWQDFLKRTI